MDIVFLAAIGMLLLAVVGLVAGCSVLERKQ